MTKLARVKNEIRALIEAHAPHQAIAPERYWQEKCGVSRETVRRAIEALILENLLYRKAPLGTFIAPPRHGRTILIVSHDQLPGKFLPTLFPPFLTTLMLQLHQADPSLLPVLTSLKSFQKDQKDLLSLYPDLSVIIVHHYQEAMLESYTYLARQGIKVILVGSLLGSLPKSLSGVFFKEADVTDLALKELTRKNFETVSILGPHHYPVVEARIRMFQKKVHKLGVRLLKLPIVEPLGLLKFSLSEPLVRSLICQKKPLGLFCTTDTFAIRLVNSLAHPKIEIPNKLALLGVEGSSIGELARIPVSMVSIPTYQMGQNVVLMLMNLLGGGQPKVEFIPVELTRRLTT